MIEVPVICDLSVIPVRKEPSDRSEMVTQLLFGETAKVVESHGNWRRIINDYDGYSGWVDVKQIKELPEKTSNSIYVGDLIQIAISGSEIIPLLIGSELPGFSSKQFHIAGKDYSFEGNTISKELPKPQNIIEQAYMFLNAPYLWGGRSPFGIDCSGFTQMTFKLCGIPLLRDASQQVTQGTDVHLLEESQPGDLAFFDNKEGRIIHVGILISPDKIIHASGRVRIDKIDHHGIYNEAMKNYTHKMRVIKRIKG